MTTTTTGRHAEPWPTRREREGSPARTTGALEQSGPRHAAPAGPATRDRGPVAGRVTAVGIAAPALATPSSAAPAVVATSFPAPAFATPIDTGTQRLPVVVPQQRFAPDSAPAVAARPVTSGPRPVPSTPCPPRPAVGSGVGSTGPHLAGHRVDGRVRSPRNGLGVAALCLGAIGLPFGLAPVVALVAAGLGALALAFGIAGWRRTRSRSATNRGTAVTGAVLGLVALALGVLGTVAFVRAPDRPTYDVSRLTAPAAAVVTIGE